MLGHAEAARLVARKGPVDFFKGMSRRYYGAILCHVLCVPTHCTARCPCQCSKTTMSLYLGAAPRTMVMLRRQFATPTSQSHRRRVGSHSRTVVAADWRLLALLALGSLGSRRLFPMDASSLEWRIA